MFGKLFRKFTLRNILIMVFLTVIYFIAGKLGLKLAFVNASATAVWPPTGIAIAAFLILGYRVWPAIFLGAFLVNITTAGSLPSTIGIAIGNTLEGFVGAYLVNKFANRREAFTSPPNIFKFAIFAGGISTMVSATIGVVSLILNGLAQKSEFGSIWITWWLGDLGGALIIAPLLVILSNRLTFRWNFRKAFETACLFLILICVASVIFFSRNKEISITSHPYLIFPILMWIGFRLGQKATAIATFLLAAIATFATLNGTGPFSGAAQNDALLLLQVFMGVTTISALILSAAILEREKAQDEIRRRQEKLEEEKVKDDSILESIGDGLIVTDDKGEIILMNLAAESLLALKSHELIGRPLIESVPMENEKGEIVPMENRPMTIALSSGKRFNGTFAYLKIDKTKILVNITVTPILHKGKIIGTIEIFRDVTKEKEIEKEKSEFLALAAHQLRTPLATIRWNIELLLGKKLDPQTKKKLESMYSSNLRLIQLVKDLLNIQRTDRDKPTGKIAKINPSDVIEEVYREYISFAQKRRVVLKPIVKVGEIPSIISDPHQFKEIIVNLISNAIKYNKPGGSVGIKIGKKDNNLTIDIEDTGLGISSKDQGKIFSQFYRTELALLKEPQGTGLGLYLVKSFVERMRGRVWFESKENIGTIFHLELPKVVKT